MRYLLIILALGTLHASLSAAVGAVGNGPNNGNGRLMNVPPDWIADPTVGGTIQAVVASWPAGTPAAERKKIRAEAVDQLITTFKLPRTAKIKEMHSWLEPDSQKTYSHLVANP